MPRLGTHSPPEAGIGPPADPPTGRSPAEKPPALSPYASDGTDPHDLAFDFATLAESDEYINALYYGREGSGKTTDIAFMANLPARNDAPGHVLIVNAEGGIKKSALRKRGVDTTRIKIWPDPTHPEPITFQRLEALHQRLLSDLLERPGCWLGVGFDSSTEFVQLLRENATNNRRARLRAQNKEFDPDLIDRGDYGVETDQLAQLIRRFRDLPCHFAITALETFNDDPAKGSLGVVPAVNPAMRTLLLGYVDVVLNCRASQDAAGEDDNDDAVVDFRARTRPVKGTRAKDRFDALPRILAEPTFVRLAGYINGLIEEDDDPIQAEYNVRRDAERAAKATAEAERLARRAGAATGARRGGARPAADAVAG